MHPPTFTRLFLAGIVLCAGLQAQNRELLGEYRLGILGREAGNAIYQAVHSGAEDAARELAERLSIDIEILERTPVKNLPRAQMEALSRLFVEEVDGVALSPADGALLRPLLETMQGQGVEVVLFESAIDGFQPRTAFPADETEAGRLAGLAAKQAMPSGGRAAILIAADKTPALQARLDGVRSTLGFRRIYGIIECDPDYASAVAAIKAATEADADDLIAGWVFLDDWPLRGAPSLPWDEGEGACAAIGVSPSALLHLERGYVDALVVHAYYEWGYRSVEALIEAVHQPPVAADTASDARESGRAYARDIRRPRVIDWRNRDAYSEAWKGWMQ
jgi:ABC-type sugar transport system substrate-binding protein